MQNNSRFFCNQQCEYFPCHEISQEQRDGFNCMFCYCPFYTKSECPGYPVYILGAYGQAIKDCSQCLYPHNPHNYEYLMQEMSNAVQVISVTCEELYDEALKLCLQYAGVKKMQEDMGTMHRTYICNIYEDTFADCKISIALEAFDRAIIKPGKFTIAGQDVECQLLHRIDLSQIEKGYFAAFTAPAKDETAYRENQVLEQFYFELWQTAFLDAGRMWIQAYLQRKESVRLKRYVLDSIGPGFYGMLVDNMVQLAEIPCMKAAGIDVDKFGQMMPKQSIFGIFLVMTKELSFSIGDCASCVGTEQGCEYCRYFHKS